MHCLGVTVRKRRNSQIFFKGTIKVGNIGKAGNILHDSMKKLKLEGI